MICGSVLKYHVILFNHSIRLSARHSVVKQELTNSTLRLNASIFKIHRLNIPGTKRTELTPRQNSKTGQYNFKQIREIPRPLSTYHQNAPELIDTNGQPTDQCKSN